MNPLNRLGVDEATLDALRARLATEAGDEVEIAYRTVDSPVGTLLLAATPEGVLRVAFASEGLDDVLSSLAKQVSPRILNGGNRLDPLAHALDRYFAGEMQAFSLALDLRLSRGFRKVVQEYLPQIAYGTTQSYGEVAEHVGNPKAVRAVGTACATNPLPIVVPCHRVTRSDGSLGQYLGGVAAKQTLLDLEASARR